MCDVRRLVRSPHGLIVVCHVRLLIMLHMRDVRRRFLVRNMWRRFVVRYVRLFILFDMRDVR